MSGIISIIIVVIFIIATVGIMDLAYQVYKLNKSINNVKKDIDWIKTNITYRNNDIQILDCRIIEIKQLCERIKEIDNFNSKRYKTLIDEITKLSQQIAENNKAKISVLMD